MTALGLTVVDWIVIGVVAVSALLAMVRGFVKEVLSVFAWVGAILGTLYGFGLARQIAAKFIEWPQVADIVAGVVLFVAIIVALSMISSAIGKAVQATQFNLLDRSLGLLFGLLRGAVVVCLAYLLLSLVLPVKEQPEYIRKAKLIGLAETGAEWLYKLVPAEYRKRGESTLNDARGTYEQGVQAKKALDSLGGAMPKALQDLEKEKGYKPEDRQRIEQLLRNSPSK